MALAATVPAVAIPLIEETVAACKVGQMSSRRATGVGNRRQNWSFLVHTTGPRLVADARICTWSPKGWSSSIMDAEGNWLPEWRPWPGESVTLHLTRPQGVPGNTLTIDRSRLELNPGTHATDATLTISLRSSQGGQHTVTLPEQAELQSVTIDGTTQPIRQHATGYAAAGPGEQPRPWWRDKRNLEAAGLPEIDPAAERNHFDHVFVQIDGCC